MSKLLFALFLGWGLTFTANAQPDEAPPKSGPCKKIHEACESAGFAKGKHKEGKGIMWDCMKPLMDGKTVEGVSVTAEDLEACKAAKGQRMQKKMDRMEKRMNKGKKGPPDGAPGASGTPATGTPAAESPTPAAPASNQ